MRSPGVDSDTEGDPDDKHRSVRVKLEDEVVPEVEKMLGWTTALQKLIKGKTAMDKEVSVSDNR